MKKILPGERKTVSSGMNIDSKLFVDDKKIADAFNKFFTGTVTRLVQTLGNLLSAHCIQFQQSTNRKVLFYV